MAGVFGPSQDGESENGSGTQNPMSGFDVTGKVLSLVTFFAPAKKVTRRKAKALGFSMWLDPVLRRTSSKARSRAFALMGELLFFEGAKKSNQKKPPSPTVRSSQVSFLAIFGLANPWLDPKTAAIHGRRPPGFRVAVASGRLGEINGSTASLALGCRFICANDIAKL